MRMRVATPLSTAVMRPSGVGSSSLLPLPGAPLPPPNGGVPGGGVPCASKMSASGFCFHVTVQKSGSHPGPVVTPRAHDRAQSLISRRCVLAVPHVDERGIDQGLDTHRIASQRPRLLLHVCCGLRPRLCAAALLLGAARLRRCRGLCS